MKKKLNINREKKVEENVVPVEEVEETEVDETEVDETEVEDDEVEDDEVEDDEVEEDDEEVKAKPIKKVTKKVTSVKKAKPIIVKKNVTKPVSNKEVKKKIISDDKPREIIFPVFSSDMSRIPYDRYDELLLFMINNDEKYARLRDLNKIQRKDFLHLIDEALSDLNSMNISASPFGTSTRMNIKVKDAVIYSPNKNLKGAQNSWTLKKPSVNATIKIPIYGGETIKSTIEPDIENGIFTDDDGNVYKLSELTKEFEQEMIDRRKEPIEH